MLLVPHRTGANDYHDRIPPQYPGQRYFQQVDNQNWHSHGAIPRYWPTTITHLYPDTRRNMNHGLALPANTEPTTIRQPASSSQEFVGGNISVVGSERLFPDLSGEYQNENERPGFGNYSVAHQALNTAAASDKLIRDGTSTNGIETELNRVHQSQVQ